MKKINSVLLTAVFAANLCSVCSVLVGDTQKSPNDQYDISVNKIEKKEDTQKSWNEQYVEKFGMLTKSDIPAKKIEGEDVKALEFMLSKKKKILSLIVNAADNVDNADNFIGGLEQKLKGKVASGAMDKVKRDVAKNFANVIQKPVQDFLGNLQQDWCKQYFISLVQTIYVGSKVPFEESWINRFLHCNPAEAKTFLSKNIVTIEDLNNVCKELGAIFGSFRLTMPSLF